MRESLSDHEKLETEIPDTKSINSEDSVMIRQRPVSIAKSDYSENGMRDFRGVEEDVVNDNSNDNEEREKEQEEVRDDFATKKGEGTERDGRSDHDNDDQRDEVEAPEADSSARHGHISSIVPDLAHEDK